MILYTHWLCHCSGSENDAEEGLLEVLHGSQVLHNSYIFSGLVNLFSTDFWHITVH